MNESEKTTSQATEAALIQIWQIGIQCFGVTGLMEISTQRDSKEVVRGIR
ncbi:hypothetical protein [Nostoc sp.]